ncbi:hypothetical protein BDQ12DRAFT_612424 [Crucibulum laeve]|uniref:Uncharacterized protein n=1 Tax=Crucibulum laeve TaxID=68775 RepID=A0A5C3LSZ7_9AGAR|nr:hypothetical protein BDQ12DRAFT_612424 [Crucibulum laeve]
MNTHYPRPINRGPPAQFLTKFQNMDESWQMTDELMADIERAADQQQSQNLNNNSIGAHPYLAGYGRGESASPPKDPNVERIRASERSSPKEIESVQQRRQREQQARESPKTRDRQPTSPAVAAFVQAHTPERRMSPAHLSPLGSPGEHTSGYGQYVTRDSPPVLRRTANTANNESRATVSSHTPPLHSIRTPDRSLPVQEEAEDDVGVSSKDGAGAREPWKNAEQAHIEHHRRSLSPAPSSDLNPEGDSQRYDGSHPHGGRDSRSGHREGDKSLLEKGDVGGDRRYQEREHEDEGYTPRSPTASLPETPQDLYFPPQLGRNSGTIRAKGRNGSTDQMGMRSLDPTVFEQPLSINNSQQPTPLSDHPPKYVEPRRPTQAQARPQENQPQYQHEQRYNNDSRASQNGYYPPQVYPDDFQYEDTASAYIQAYLQSARPDAPIPPTPRSQTAAPSPSPLVSGGYDGGGKELPPFSPVAPVGSPYPYPFSHVRRNQPLNGPNRPQFPSNQSNQDPNHPSVIQEQIARQWQVYAQNNHGNVSDSTFSPSSTPFQGAAGYNPWALWHMNRTFGRMHDTISMQSSPSHEPVPLPPPPPVVMKKKDHLGLRRHSSSRKPPPRVESTQPRETSPEPSSSGEETAGEEHFAIREEPQWVNGPSPVVAEDDSADWIDEDEDGDDDDLLELEYHPVFVSNVEKRRRRWEIGWDNLVQAFQTLDRQTDATMVLLAAPSHSTKLYSIKSRAIRRQPGLSQSTGLTEIRGGFKRIAAHRRTTRSHKSSLIDRFLVPSSSSGDGSDGSSESREEDLRRALETALGSLGALGGIYEQREARWIEEMRRISEDRERVELLLRQVLGENHPLSNLLPRGP